MFYKYTQEEKIIGVTEGIAYITELENDCIVVGTEENAMGCTVNGVNYHLEGKPPTKQLYQLVKAVEIEEEEYNRLKPLYDVNEQYGLQNYIVNQIKDDGIAEVQEALNGIDNKAEGTV